MTLVPYRKHEPCIPIDGTKCIHCGQSPNNYVYHLKVIGVNPKTFELIYEGDNR